MMDEPKLIAQFEMDPDGAPKIIDARGKKHYKIVFKVKDAPEAYAATFELDPSYIDPVRNVSPDTIGEFALKTTTYGDYAVKVLLQTKEGQLQLTDSVSNALSRGTGPERSALIDEALAYIKEH